MHCLYAECEPGGSVGIGATRRLRASIRLRLSLSPDAGTADISVTHPGVCGCDLTVALWVHKKPFRYGPTRATAFGTTRLVPAAPATEGGRITLSKYVDRPEYRLMTRTTANACNTEQQVDISKQKDTHVSCTLQIRGLDALVEYTARRLGVPVLSDARIAAAHKDIAVLSAQQELSISTQLLRDLHTLLACTPMEGAVAAKLLQHASTRLREARARAALIRAV